MEEIAKENKGFEKSLEKPETIMKMELPLPFNKESNNTKPSEEKIGCLSYFSLNWMNSHMWKASRSQIEQNQIKNLTIKNGVDVNANKLQLLWNREFAKNGKNLSLFSIICKFSLLPFISSSIFITSMAILNYIGPSWILKQMLYCLETPRLSIWYGIAWACVFSATQLGRHIMFNAYWVTSTYAGIRVSAALQGLIYEKLISVKSAGIIDTAEMVNFATMDQERIFQMIQTMTLAVPPLLITITHIVYCYLQIGPWSLLGNVIMLLYAPFTLYITNYTSKFRTKAAAMSDKRIGIMSQILFNIKFIKMMTWEDVLCAKVKEIRNSESKSLEKAVFLQSISWAVVVITGHLALMLAVIGYVLTGNVLTSNQVLNLMSAFAALSTPLGTVVLAVKGVSEGLISCRRIKEFLIQPDVTSPIKDSKYHSSGNPIEIKDMDADWCAPNTKGKDNKAFQSNENLKIRQAVLSKINLSVKKSKLIGICGPVGSGKSTLLSTICGNNDIEWLRTRQWIDIPSDSAGMDIQWNSGAEYYIWPAIQQGMVFNGGFGVLPRQRLSADAKGRSDGGERGANLSGGQKQRINLARALYSNRDVYLLDDPLSAIDAKVAQSIFKQYVQTHLRYKTVVMVTHVPHYLEMCDCIVVLEDGTICEQGTHDVLMARNNKYAQMVRQNDEANKTKTDQNIVTTETKVQSILKDETDNYDGKMIKAEIENKSTVSFKTLLYFAKQCGGCLTTFPLFASLLLFGAVAVFNNVWFKIWLTSNVELHSSMQFMNSTHDRNISSPMVIYITDPNFYTDLIVYVATIVALLLFAILKGFALKKFMLRGNTQLHTEMMKKAVRSPMVFFDSTPLGRIINRFSRDMDELDVHVPSLGEYVNQTLIIVIFQTIVVCCLYPWFTIALILIIVMFTSFDKIFTPAVQETKRLDNLLMPPVLNHLNTSIQGLEVIKCYNKQQLFTNMFRDLSEKHLAAYLQYQLSSKWISFRVDIIGWVAITILAVMIMSSKGDLHVVNGGLSLVLIIQACIILSVALRLKSELGAKLTSMERICDYTINLVEEAPAIVKDNRPSEQWPTKGKVEFRNVFLKYRPENPLVLHGFHVIIQGGEKVGIIGRTGAGKSSILVALLRLTEVHEGAILIDDLDISKIGLEDLRRKVAVIPQDPVLLSGTVRFNLDPFNEYDDEEIWKTLEKCNLTTKIRNAPMQLEMTINPDSGMFSVGEKQLFCLARALLKNSKILLLDEATANVDLETDQLVQKSIRSCFGNCTVLTIAHRLNTIVDYDKILTMEAGKVLEFDSPKNLLSTNSHFRSMLDAQV